MKEPIKRHSPLIFIGFSSTWPHLVMNKAQKMQKQEEQRAKRVMLGHVHQLAEKIGPRGTGTDGEKQAAEYVARCLKKWGIPFERLTCRTIISMNHYPLIICVMGLLAVLLYPLNGSLTRWIAAVLAILVAPFMGLTIRTSGNPLRFILPKVTSPSILGKIEPAGKVKHQVTLLSHLDTNKCRLTWKPERLGSLEPLTYVTLGMQAIFGLLYLIGAVVGQRWTFWLLSLVPAAYMLAMLITLIIDDRTPYSPGANDNASSVGVVLDIARQMTKQPLAQTRLWLAFTGAEETDHYGLRSVLSAHPEEMRQALFIDLEGVGGGDLIYVTRHGIGLHYAPDPELLNWAKMVAKEHPGWGVRGEKMTMSEEVSTITHLGYHAVCLAGRGPLTGGLPKWHQHDDTFENIDPDSLLKAKNFTLALLRAIDKKKAI